MAKESDKGNPYSADVVNGMDAIATFLEKVPAPAAGDPLFKDYEKARKACGGIINAVGDLADLRIGDMCQGGLPRRTIR